MAGKEKGTNVRPQVSWPHATRDIVIRAMDRGQLPILALCVLAIVMVWRMPSAQVSTLAFEVVRNLEHGALGGWALSGAVSLGWYKHAGYMRRIHAQECDRIGTEKSKAQALAHGRKLPSSKRK